MELFVIVFIGLIGQTTAVVLPKKQITLQFRPHYLTYHQFTNVTLGTPGTMMTIGLLELDQNQNLKVPMKLAGSSDEWNFYVPTASKTHKLLSEEKNKNGVVVSGLATDNIKAGNVFLKGKPFEIRNWPLAGWQEFRTGFADMSLNRPVNNSKNHFLQSILDGYNKQVAVVTFDKPGQNSNPQPNLKLTLGEIPQNHCKNDWRYLNEPIQGTDSQWTLKIDSVKVGNFVSKNNLKGKLFLMSEYLHWPAGDHDQIVKELGGANGNIPCSTDKDITIKFELRLMPSEYLIHKDDGSCELIGVKNDKNFYDITRKFFYDKCLSLDFANKRVGFASRKF